MARVARIYVPLGIVSPVTLQGKFLYREDCELKQTWDAPLQKNLVSKWEVGERSAHRRKLHAFGDASVRGVAAAVYAVVRQASKTTQGLVTAKARLAKQG